MELTRDLPGEPLPIGAREGSIIGSVSSTEDVNQNMMAEMTDAELAEKVENMLVEKVKAGDKQALFQLGQLYFEQGAYDKARIYFERAKDFDLQCLYQLGVIYYDGLGCKPDYKAGVECMMQIAKDTSKKAEHLIRAAQYNVGRAYFQGYGVRRQDDKEAEKWWLLAADDGNPKASILAQSVLGMYYSREETLDLKKAFFWHNEACGNGSLESQGALGVMYELGIGARKEVNSAMECYKEAAERGNVYAMGHLVKCYYTRKLYTKAADLASRVSQLQDVEQIASETNCQAAYIAKGISMACFFYARALQMGHGVKPNKEDAQKYYTRSYHFDPDMCALLQNSTTYGAI